MIILQFLLGTLVVIMVFSIFRLIGALPRWFKVGWLCLTNDDIGDGSDVFEVISSDILNGLLLIVAIGLVGVILVAMVVFGQLITDAIWNT